MKKLIFLLFLTGCGYKNWSNQISLFATAAPIQLGTVSDSYTNSSDVDLLRQKVMLADQYSTSGYHPGQIKKSISKQDMLVRSAAITSLKNYANALSSIISSTHTASFKQSYSPDYITIGNTILTVHEMSLAISGLDAISAATIQHKSKRKIRAIMIEADPIIQRLAVLLVADLTDLKKHESNDYSNVLIIQHQFIEHNKATMSDSDKKYEIEKLIEIESSQITAQDKLDDAIQNIKDFAALHHKLTELK